MTVFLAAVLTALCISAICSLLEATLLSLTPSQVAEMAQRRPRTAAIWQRFKLNIEKPIAVILVLNTAAHTIGASVAGAEFEELWGDRWLFAFSLFLTYLMLQFTEILPKTLGVRYNQRLAPVIARPLDFLQWSFSPVLRFIHLVNRPFEGRRPAASTHRALTEITALASIARTANAIDPQQARLIMAAARLPEMRVRQIMTPRPQVAFLRMDQPLSQVLKLLQGSPFTRLPLCEEDIDHVVGMIHVRDLFNHLKLVPGRLRFAGMEGDEHIAVADGAPGSALHVIGSGDIDWRKIRRNVLFVPETTFVPHLLKQFQESRIHMAVVVDEYGATQGVVTLEDVVEEMVGDIQDEFDVVPAAPFLAEGDVYRVNGSCPLHELVEHLGLKIEDEEAATLNGYLVQQLGRFPEVGDRLKIGGFEARVVSTERRRAKMVEIKRIDESESGAQER